MTEMAYLLERTINEYIAYDTDCNHLSKNHLLFEGWKLQSMFLMEYKHFEIISWWPQLSLRGIKINFIVCGFVANTTLVVIVVKVKLQARFNKNIFQKWRKLTFTPRWSLLLWKWNYKLVLIKTYFRNGENSLLYHGDRLEGNHWRC